MTRLDHYGRSVSGLHYATFFSIILITNSSRIPNTSQWISISPRSLYMLLGIIPFILAWGLGGHYPVMLYNPCTVCASRPPNSFPLHECFQYTWRLLMVGYQTAQEVLCQAHVDSEICLLHDIDIAEHARHIYRIRRRSILYGCHWGAGWSGVGDWGREGILNLVAYTLFFSFSLIPHNLP